MCAMDVPVSQRVVERTACFHRLEVKDAPADGRQRQSRPEHGQNPDDGAHGHRRAPKHLLLWKQMQRTHLPIYSRSAKTVRQNRIKMIIKATKP